jgi:hypothetical protein
MDRKEKPLLAYYVGDDDRGCIVFAKTNAQARRYGANEIGTDWECVECRRTPEWDGGQPTWEELWDAGWHFECAICSTYAFKDCDGAYRDGEFYCYEHSDPYVWRDPFPEYQRWGREPYSWRLTRHV